MQRTDQPEAPDTPAPTIGTPSEAPDHRPPAPTPTEHVATFRADRPGDCVSDH